MSSMFIKQAVILRIRSRKKTAAFFLCAAVCIGRLFAQEGISAFSAGLGFQVNNYSRELVGLGIMVNTDIRLGEMFSLGGNILYNFDLGGSKKKEWESSLKVMDLYISPRFYFLRSKKLRDYYFEWQSYLHWFLQADVGFCVMDIETVKVASFVLTGTVGVRIYKNNFYIEPYLRGGVPVIWGVGLLAGYRFTGQD